MRKKSHISVAKLIVGNTKNDALKRHRKAFYLGSVLPDCKPSFLTKRHEYEGTFEETADEIKKLAGEGERVKKDSAAYFRKLGEVLHFLADYFTFPHNKIYEGNLKDHCQYEKYLKNYLKDYIESGRAALQEQRMRRFTDAEEILAFIREAHREYVGRIHSIEEDVKYIVRLCVQVVYGILMLLAKSEEGGQEVLRLA